MAFRRFDPSIITDPACEVEVLLYDNQETEEWFAELTNDHGCAMVSLLDVNWN